MGYCGRDNDPEGRCAYRHAGDSDTSEQAEAFL